MHSITGRKSEVLSHIFFALLLLLQSPSALQAEKATNNRIASRENGGSVTIIFDNYRGEADLGTAWGFACLVKYGDHRLLFDTGSDADLYRENVLQLDISPEEIPGLFISHAHADHTAGIPWVTATNPSIQCFLPAGYAEQLKTAGNLPDNSKAIAKPAHLYGPFYSTGDDFENFREQALVIKTPDGGVLVTGCGHPGVVEMVTVAREQLNIPVHAVIGGLHLLNYPDAQVEAIAERLKDLGIKQICATHCTGDRAIAVFKQAFGDGYIPGGVGTRINIE